MNIELRITADLRVHPALKHIPELDREGAEFQAIARCHEEELGRPLNIDADGRVLDDTSRTLLAVAKRWQHNEVPVRVRAEEDMHQLVIRDLAGRRHFSKSAIAYLLFPHFDPAASREKQLAGLKNIKNANVSRCGLSPQRSGRDIAADAGIDEKLLRMAKDVHTLFEDERLYKFGIHGGDRDGLIERLTLKAYFEPRLLKHFVGSEHEHTRPLGLGSVLREAAIVREGKSFVGEDRPDKTEEQMEFWTRPLTPVRSRFARWDQLSAQARGHAVNAWQILIKQLPDDLLDTTMEIIERKRRKAGDE